METFLNKTITETSENYPQIKVIRTRTSAGYAGITIKTVRGDIEFTNEAGNSTYEDEARELVRILDIIVDNPCNLPMEER